MAEPVRRRFGRWIRREVPEPPRTALFADHEEIQDIARQMTRTKGELDRSVLALRSWARNLGRHLSDAGFATDRREDLHALGATVGGLAHNLNNSLATILAYAEMMLREDPAPSAQRRLTVVREVALEASATVRRLQDFISHQPQAAFGPVALPGVISEAIDMAAPRWRDEADRRGISITVVRDVEALPPVEGDAIELRDAILGLVLNAVTAMPQGGVLTIRAAPSSDSDWVEIEVRDTGVGMADEVRREVIERARSLRPGRDFGYGLDHIFEIVERHEGTLSIESELGKGTRVRIRLRASRFQIIPPSAKAGARALTPDQSVRIVLVDDSPRLLTVVSDMLRAAGHTVTTSTSGEEALELFDPSQHDVVITDLGMPRMNGWEIAERVKKRSSSTAVFILTGWGESVSGHESRQYVDRVIAKPIAVESLLDQLAELKRSGLPPSA